MKTIEKKEPYLHILNTRGNVYEEFLPDQVLTHKNLNKVVDYFEDQDRLSRIYLTGVGVGCGLNIVSSTNSKYIEIGQGVGITTDGDIIKSETRKFQYYSALTDNANYAIFQRGEMKVYEIYEQEAAGRQNDELPLASFSIQERTTLKDCIVIAYVENYTEDEGLCGGSGCDETGNKVFSNLKFLITHKSNKDLLIGTDTIYQSHDVLAYYDSLPDLCLPRIILTKNNTNAGMPILKQYKDTFVLKDDLYLGILKIITKFSQRINFQKFGVFTTEIANYINTIFSQSDDEYVQYRYDLLRDLIETYREIKELILHSKFECVPNVKSFPKHLLLGTPEPTSRLETRHQFYPSPMVSENDENLIAIRTLCIKFFNQLKDFNIIDFNSAQIKITPSKAYDSKLSERTIPYYYRSKSALVNNWNPASNKNRKSSYQLGYHTGNLKGIDCITDPLKYNHLDKDFYRIEGHQGKNFVIALRNILKKKEEYNLPFDVKAISIGYPINKISLDEDTCETKEYATLLKTWEEEFNCTADKAIDFFRRYQYDVIGVNDTVTDVHTVLTAVQAESDKEVAQVVENVKDVNPNTRDEVKTPLSVAGSIKVSLKEEATTSTKQKAALAEAITSGRQKATISRDKITVAANLPTNFTSVATYKRSLSFVIENVVSSINPENLTADYVVAQVVSGYDRVGNNQVDVDSDKFKLYVEIPLRIITNLEIVKYRFIKELQDVYVTERWTAFHTAFADLCSEVQKILFTLSTTTDNGTFGKNVHDKMYEFLIHKIGGLCCLKEKFNWLKLQLDDIRLNLYKELILSKFIEQHPGLEHMAGVPKGGTFLLVYVGEEQVKLEDADARVETFDRKVLLDFALPYMCMSECAPKTIVYSDIVDPVTLAIARKKFCLPSDNAQEDFIIEPERGVVTSPDGTAFIITTAEGYAFDPTQVPDALLGEGIRFLVDGKIPTIPIETMVYKLPEAVTATYEFVAWTEDGLVINLNVTHELEDLLYLQHAWKRDNGSEIALGKSPTNILILTDGNLFQEDITLVIDVIGNPVPCKLEIPVTIDEEREIIVVDVEVLSEICFNTQETSPNTPVITVMPPDGTVTSPQEPANGQSFIEFFNDVYTINPLHVPDALAGEPITFAVNDVAVENVETRVYKLPGSVTTESALVSWDATGLFVNITATHAYANKSYLSYEWIDENDEVVGTTLNMPNFRIDTTDSSVNRTFSLQMRVIGSENELCQASGFSVTVSEDRPEITVSIPPAICCQENVQSEPIDIIISGGFPELTCPQQDEFGVELLGGDTEGYRFNIDAVPNELIGVPIIFEIAGNPVASTIVYKVPAGVEAAYNNATWSGNTLEIDIAATHSLEGQIATIEDYLEYIWKDEDDNIVLTTKERINFEIITEAGSINKDYTVDVKVRDVLIENPCGHFGANLVIDESRPNVTITIVPEICCIDSGDTIPETYPIVVTPSSFSISSPDGNAFIQGIRGNYRFNPAAVPEELLGQEIRLVADGEIKATTKVYKIPELIRTSISVTNESWVSGGLAIDLSSTIISRSYYTYEWFMRRNNVDTILDKISEPNRYLIPDTGDGVNVEVFLRLSANTDGILCSQETRKTRITRFRAISVSKDRFCIPDTPVVFRGVSEETGVLKSASAGLPATAITINSGRYVFNPNEVPNSLLGTNLRFSVNDSIQSGVLIRVYRTPEKESIVEDVLASQWVTGGYEFVFTHELIDKSYFSYQVVLKSDGSDLREVGTHRYLIPTNDDGINDEVVVMISISGVSCTEGRTIPVDTTRPTQPVGRLDCGTPYKVRLELLGVDTLISSIQASYSKQNFEDDIITRIFNPLDQIILGIVGATNLNSIADPATRAINGLRTILAADFYKNPNIDSGFYQSFLELDEVLELVVLELLRCVDAIDDNLINATDKFFGHSTNINSEYTEKPRHTINSSYVSGFSPNVSLFKTTVDATYNTATKKRK